MVSGLGQIAEEKIRKAMEDGQFDRLRGQGKPLKLQENPFEPEGWRMAFHLIRQNGFSLPWIEVGMEIERERLAAHRLLRCACQELEPEARRQAEYHFAQQIEALNREINQYNLRVPAAVFQRGTLDLETERAAALCDRLSPPPAESLPQE